MENNLKKMFDQEQERKELHESAAALVLSSYLMGKSFIPLDSELKADDFLEQLNRTMEKQKRGMMNADVRLLFYKKAILLHFLMFKCSHPTASKLDFEIEIDKVYNDFDSLLTGSNMLGQLGVSKSTVQTASSVSRFLLDRKPLQNLINSISSLMGNEFIDYDRKKMEIQKILSGIQEFEYFNSNEALKYLKFGFNSLAELMECDEELTRQGLTMFPTESSDNVLHE